MRSLSESYGNVRFITRERVMGGPTLDAVQRRRRPWTPYQRIEMCGAECVVCWEVRLTVELGSYVDALSQGAPDGAVGHKSK